MLAHTYNIIIDRGVGSPEHFREVFNGLNEREKNSINFNDNYANFC